MAASAFKVFRRAKRGLGTGAIVLNSGNFKLALVISGATMLSAQSSASTWASLKTDGVTELVSGGNYSSSGTALTVTWTITANGTTCIFDATDWSLSANGVTHADIKACVIRQSASDKIVAYASLSSAKFDIADGNKLIIAFDASGVFTLT